MWVTSDMSDQPARPRVELVAKRAPARSFAPAARILEIPHATNTTDLAARLRQLTSVCRTAGLAGALSALADDVDRGDRVAYALESLARTFIQDPIARTVKSLADDAADLEGRI